MANPLLSSNSARQELDYGAEVATASGTASKIFVLLSIVLMSAVASASGVIPLSMSLLVGCFLVATAIAFGAYYAPQYAAPLSLIYAVAEGIIIGGISAMYAAKFHGIVLQAVLGTFGVAFACMVLYASGLIKVNEKFLSVVKAGLLGVALVYAIDIILGLFGMRVPYLHTGGPIGIGISLVIIVIAAMTLLADFYFVDESIRTGAPKYMEWLSAFGIIVTLVWMYVEILRLIANISSDD